MRSFALGAILTIVSGCSAADPSSSDSDSRDAPQSGCETGASAPCTCGDGNSGQTQCGSDRKFGACACQAPSGACSATPTSAFSGSQACLDPGQLGAFVVDWLVSFWGTQPTLLCVYDSQAGASFTGPCGDTIPDNASFCRADGSMTWDATFLNSQAANYGNFAASVVIGHEWGHLNDAVLEIDLPTTFAREQHADCQAGFASAAAQAAGLLTDMDLTVGYEAMCLGGGTSGWYDPTGHGSCYERQEAFNVGYQGALQMLAAACGSDPLSAMRLVCA
jgi:hypothetical protein